MTVRALLGCIGAIFVFGLLAVLGSRCDPGPGSSSNGSPSATSSVTEVSMPKTPSGNLAAIDGASPEDVAKYEKLVWSLANHYPDADETKVSDIVANVYNILHKDGATAADRSRTCLEILHDLDNLPVAGGPNDKLADKATAYAMIATSKDK